MGRFRNMVVVSTSTLGSRVLGLLRDVLVFAMLGASQWSSAFIFAFTLPNLFRRLLGEGALTSALVPVLADVRAREKEAGAFALLNQTLSRVGVALVILTVAAMGVLAVVLVLPGLEERWYLGSRFGLVLMPYMILVCLAALMGAALNVCGKFGVAALSTVWLNLAMILSLGLFGWTLAETPEARVWYLCGGVLIGGVIQVAAPMAALALLGWRPRVDMQRSAGVAEIMRLLVPGLVGAGILQVNIVVSRVLALYVNESAVSELYLANRLVELPLGLFTIAVTTVVFPEIARMAAQRNTGRLREAYGEGLRLIFAITIPATVGLVLLAEPILWTLFAWGRFDATDVTRTAPILIVFALTVPIYSLSIYCTRCFHSIKDMRSPVRMAWWAFVANTALSLALMVPFGTLGLALANLGSSALQAALLFALLRRADAAFVGARLVKALQKIVLAGLAMGLVVWLVLQGSHYFAETEPEKVRAIWAVAVGIPVGVAVYFGLLWLLRFEDRRLVLELFKRKPRKVA